MFYYMKMRVNFFSVFT